MENIRKARVGFVVLKLRSGDANYYLMRRNPKWKDINFIGGHEKDRDTSDLSKTAQRELWEEVPPFRTYSKFKLRPLTDILGYGPVFSRSRGDQAKYEIQFFLVEIEEPPEKLVEALSSRSKNVWVNEKEFETPEKFNLSGLANFFKTKVDGGLISIPLSNPSDLSTLRPYFEGSEGNQREFAFR
jgi:hypothetical protein